MLLSQSNNLRVENVFTIFRIDNMKKINGYCLESIDYAESIKGTFENGHLHGSVKISYNFNRNLHDSFYFDLAKVKNPYREMSMEISEFRHGFRHGISRKWNSKNQLTHVGYHNIYIMSRTWSRIGDFIVYSDESFIKSWQNDHTEHDFIMNLSSGDGYAGNYMRHFGLFDAKFKVTVLKEGFTLDCLPKPKWKDAEPVELLISVKENEIMVKNDKEAKCSVSEEKPLADTLQGMIK